MPGVVERPNYETTHDIAGLRLAIGEIQAAHSMLSQFAELSAAMPGVPMERAAGIGDGVALVARRIRTAQERLRELTAARAARDVVVLDPERSSWVAMRDGQPILPLVGAVQVPGSVRLCSGVTRLAAGEGSRLRVYPDVDLIMVVVFGGAVISWWGENKEFRQAACRRHQHAYIPRGTPYAISNPGSVPMVAIVAHSGAEITGGAELVPELDGEISSRGRAVDDDRKVYFTAAG